MNRSNVFFIIAIFLIFSCKKDRLKNEWETLVGKWRWVKSSNGETPSTLGINYYVEFRKCGIVEFYKGSELKRELKIKKAGDNTDCSTGDCNYFQFKYDKDSLLNANVYYYASGDTLILTKFPFNQYYQNQWGFRNYENYYVRE